MVWIAGAAALALLALVWFTDGVRGWGMGVPWSALATCPGTYALSLVLLGLGLGAAALSMRVSSRWFRGAAVVLLFGGIAWTLRERNFLLGDSRFWLENMRQATGIVPVYREPLSLHILNILSSYARTPGEQKTILGVMSIVLGLVVSLAVARALPPTIRARAAAGCILVFLVPMGLLFFGHVETYPIFLAAFAWALVGLGQDAARGRLSLRTAALLLLLPGLHFMAALLVVPFAGWLVARRRPDATGWIAGSALSVLGLAVGTLLIPAARAHVTLFVPWSAMQRLSYLEDVVNGWFLLLVPLGVLAASGFRRAVRSSYGKFLAITALTYAGLPLWACLGLGVYRDFGLLGPAAVALALFAAHGLAPERGARPVFLTGLAGIPFLAGWLALGTCDGGGAFAEKQAGRPELSPEARALNYEVLAYFWHHRGDHDHAVKSMEDAMNAVPGNERMYGPLGEFQLDAGDTATALASLERSLVTKRAYKSLAALLPVLVRRGELERAVNVSACCRGDVLVTSQASAAIAVAYLRMGYPDSTVLVSQERLARDPEDHVAYYNAGAGLAAMGRLEDAADAFREAARLSPNRRGYHRAVLRVLALLPEGPERVQEYLSDLPPALVDSLRWRVEEPGP